MLKTAKSTPSLAVLLNIPAVQLTVDASAVLVVTRAIAVNRVSLDVLRPREGGRSVAIPGFLASLGHGEDVAGDASSRVVAVLVDAPRPSAHLAAVVPELGPDAALDAGRVVGDGSEAVDAAEDAGDNGREGDG